MDGNAPKNLIKIRTQEKIFTRGERRTLCPLSFSRFVWFPGKRLFRVFAFSLLYYNCNIIAPRARACGAFCRHICAISPDHIRRASLALSPPLRVSASRAFFARFARGMVNRDGRLPAAVSAYHAAPLAASRRPATGEAHHRRGRAPCAPPEYYHLL